MRLSSLSGMAFLLQLELLFLASIVTTTTTTTTVAAATPDIQLGENYTCSILSSFPTHRSDNDNSDLPAYSRYNDAELKRVSTSYLATATWAVQYFNSILHEREATSSDLIPDLAAKLQYNDDWQCPIHLSLDVISEWLDVKAGTQLYLNKSDTTCAVLGTYDHDVAKAMQPLSVATEQPQIIYSWIDGFLTLSARSSAIGMPPTVLPRIRALAEYLNVFHNREFLALLYQQAQTSSYMTQCFQEDAADKYGLVSLQYQDDHFGIIRGNQTALGLQRKVVRKIQQSGIRTIFINKLDSEGLNLTATVLEEFDMLTPDYIYVLHSIAVPIDTEGIHNVFGPLETNSPMDKLLRGAMVYDHMEPFRINPKDDIFLNQWKKLTPEDLQLQEELPEDYFTTTPPAAYSTLLFDGIVAAGVGACNMMHAKQATNTTETTFRDFIKQTNFSGVSGSVEWGCYGANRCNHPLSFGMYNVQVDTEASNDTHTQYKSVLTAVWNETSRWVKMDDVLYRNQETKEPTLLREPQDEHYLSNGTRAFGYILLATSAGAAVMGWILVLVWRRDAYMIKAQPLFLQLLCAGALILSMSILTLSLDEGLANVSSDNLNVACAMTPWFFFVGYVLCFAALAAKMWRIDTVLQFRPRQRPLTEPAAMIPVAVFLGVTILVLILWTALDPWVWARETVEMVPYESYGECHSEHFWAFFGPLMAWIVVAQTLTLVYAYKTSDVHDDYRDSELSYYAMATQCQSWVVGVPILAVLGNASSDAVFVSRALLIWILSLSNTVIVVGPRIYAALKKHREAALREKNGDSSGDHTGSTVRISGLNMTGDAAAATRNSMGTPIRKANSSRTSMCASSDGHTP